MKHVAFVQTLNIRIFAAKLLIHYLNMKKFLTTQKPTFRRLYAAVLSLAAVTAVQAATVTVTVRDNRYQTVTGFGAACCDGAMCPFGNDTNPVKLLYGPTSQIGLNIMRMEISPNFVGDVVVPEWNNYDTPYDWKGSLPSAKIVKQRGGIVFGTPWSPPGEYKTNGTAQGGNSEDQGYQRGTLRQDCYEKFFPWLNTFLAYMKKNGVYVDAVSIQNEPDWWVNYSGCLYTPDQQLKLVKENAHMLDRETYQGVRLISAEPLGFDPAYSNKLLNDPTARQQIDIIAGHLYGHPPLGNMKSANVLASKYGKEVWMTEHSVTDNIDRLPNWHEQLLFAEELNECMLAGCTGYIYWYMRAHWAFVGTGETKYNPGNTKNKLLPRAFVMSHFSKNVTGSTRLQTSATVATGTNSAFETSAYIKGDSLIVMAIDTTKNAIDLKLKLPFYVKSGTQLLSTGNETANLCQKQTLTIEQPVNEITIPLPARSLSTFVFMIDQGSAAITDPKLSRDAMTKTYYDLHGRKLDSPNGLCIERYADGFSRKVFISD
jgi:glucuronoarabinoxylan endo-1,4-beta-xylanase